MISWNDLEMKLEGDNDAGESTPMGLKLLRELWHNVMELESKRLVPLITKPSITLFDSIESGNVEVTKWLFCHSRFLVMTIREPKNGRNLLHLLILHRDFDSFTHYLDFGRVPLLEAVDNEGNNVLHMVARLPRQFEALSGLRANMHMQRELEWFKVNSFIFYS